MNKKYLLLTFIFFTTIRFDLIAHTILLRTSGNLNNNPKNYLNLNAFEDLFCISNETGYFYASPPCGFLPVPVITPASTTSFCQGSSVRLNSTTGKKYNYQWRKNGSNIFTATDSFYLANTIGNYKVVVTDSNGCIDSSSEVSVNVYPQPVAPILTKSPYLTDVCTGQNVSAVLQTSGSGGTGCSATYEYRYDGSGSWSSYTLGNNLSSSGHTIIEIRASWGGCSSGAACVTASNTYTWNIQSQPVAPVLSKNPNLLDVCSGQNVSATFLTSGSGGIGCTATYDYRYDGTGSWISYTLANSMVTSGHTLVEIRAVWGGCSSGAGCSASTNLYSWNIQPQPVAPVLVKNPNLTSVCIGQLVSASLQTAGSGGTGCSATYEYRYDGTGSWITYSLGTSLSSTSHSIIEIRAVWGGCTSGSGCTSSTNNYSWTILSQPVAPTLTKSPNLTDICSGQNISASLLAAGSGGTGCTPTYEYRYDATGSWANYTLASNLSSTGHTLIEVRSSWGGCSSGAGCTTASNTYSWTVQPQPSSPVLNKSPNTNDICIGISVSANLSASGSGGTGCSPTYEYRYDSSASWTTYVLANSLPSTGHRCIEVRGYMSGCSSGAGCVSTPNVYIWAIHAQPVAPVLVKSPNLGNVCSSLLVSAALLTAGSGGSGCTASYTYRYNDTGIWINYPLTSNLSTTGRTKIEIMSTWGNCSNTAGCTLAYNSYSWSVDQTPVASLLIKNPNLTNICSGQPVSATIQTSGSGGSGCNDIYEYRLNGTGSWSAYSIGLPISTSSATLVEIRSIRGNCTAGSGCTNTAANVYSWTVQPQPVAPVLTKSPNLADICVGQPVSASILTAASGGTGCSVIYEYRLNGSGSWVPYNLGTLINTSSCSLVEIKAGISGCSIGAGCNGTENIYSWNVRSQPVASLLSLTPDLSTVCNGISLSASVKTTGSSGIGCSATYEYRLDGSGIWSVYTPTNAIISSGHTIVEVRSKWGACTTNSGCIDSIRTYKWIIVPQPQAPDLTKKPDILNLCDGKWAKATVLNSEHGGTACNATYEYSYNHSGVWTTYHVGDSISTISKSNLNIRAIFGNCLSGSGCIPDTNNYFWTIYPQPKAPIMQKYPDLNEICSDTFVKAHVITPEYGGVGCNIHYYYRDVNQTWKSYQLDSIIKTNISTPGKIEIKSVYGNCMSDAGCQLSENIYTWNVNPDPIAFINGKTSVCKNDYWVPYSTNTKGNRYLWSIQEGEILYGNNSNDIWVHWSNNINDGKITLTETFRNTGCNTTKSLVITKKNSTSPDTLHLYLKSKDINTRLLLCPYNYDYYTWGYESKFYPVEQIESNCQNKNFCHYSQMDTSNFYYWVIVSNSNNADCPTKSYFNKSLRPFLGILETDNSDLFEIWPNPGNNYFNLLFKSDFKGQVNVKVIDMFGKFVTDYKFLNVTNSTQTQITHNLKPGIYMIVISDYLKSSGKIFVVE